MSGTSARHRKLQAQSSSVKPYWEMSAEELQRSTAEFDQEFVGETFGKPAPAQQEQLARAKRKRGRPRRGQGVRVISVSIEKGLLRDIDNLAKRQKAKRAELISRGLRAILDGSVPITAE